MPLNLFYTMVQKSRKWPKTQIKGGGSCLNSLCLPLVTRRSGELTPLYTSTLLYNNLPSELRSPNISFSLFHCTIMKYLGHPVRRP